ncbi:MAG TPA: YbhB/YbcL family Raf kinase inhibitor-like protein [Rhizomicrobium sp.]
MPFALRSSAFENGDSIPERFAQAGENVSPQLAWENPPAGAKSFVLVVEDHDAPVGTVTHWVAFDIPAERRGLPQHATGMFAEGVNDMGHNRYDGPKPPKNHGPHRYHFRLTALDVESLDLADGSPSNDIKKAARAHTLAETTLIGTFETE